MKRKCQVVMLPTEKESSICFRNYPFFNKDNITTYSNVEFRELYFLSDDEIKEGDWFFTGKYIRKCERDSGGSLGFTSYDGVAFLFIQPNFKKIIATTDKLATEPFQGYYEDIDCTKYLPKPSQDFIEVFIREYNAGRKIEEVIVEYTTKHLGFEFDENCNKSDLILKIKPDNTISIRKIKDSWSREEVTELFEKYIDAGKPVLYPWLNKNL